MYPNTNLGRRVTTAAHISQRDVLPSVNMHAINTEMGYTEPSMAISHWLKQGSEITILVEKTLQIKKLVSLTSRRYHHDSQFRSLSNLLRLR